jgi:hypothetical protein
MTKKTVSFNMPVRTESAPTLPQQAPPHLIRESGVSNGGESDWVEHPEAVEVDNRALTRASSPPAHGAEERLLIDLMAERELAEAIALSFAIPSILGWNWLAKWMQRMAAAEAPSIPSFRL